MLNHRATANVRVIESNCRSSRTLTSVTEINPSIFFLVFEAEVGSKLEKEKKLDVIVAASKRIPSKSSEKQKRCSHDAKKIDLRWRKKIETTEILQPRRTFASLSLFLSLSHSHSLSLSLSLSHAHTNISLTLSQENKEGLSPFSWRGGSSTHNWFRSKALRPPEMVIGKSMVARRTKTGPLLFRSWCVNGHSGNSPRADLLLWQLICRDAWQAADSNYVT